MAIYFACRQCGKALFAQEQYAGRAVKCPACQGENLIPAQRGGLSLPPASGGGENDPVLIDMENAPEPAGDKGQATGDKGAAPGTQGVEPSAQDPALKSQPAAINTQDSALRTQDTAPSAQDTEATRLCPMCAERIRAAAKKCRYCGTLLDEDLKAEQTHQIEKQVLSGFISDAERSAHTWRVLGILSATVTAGWLALLTVVTWQRAQPSFAIFNLLLAAGLLWNTTQMRRGPASVFFAAATAVLFCMPIDAILGLTLVDAEILNQVRSQDPKLYAKVTVEDVNRGLGLLFTFVGVIFSLPVWIATLKVMALQRLQVPREKGR